MIIDVTLHGGLVHDFFRIGLRNFQISGDMPFAHHQHAVAHAENFRQFGGNQQDRLACGGQIVEQRVDFSLGADIDATRRLIDDQELRIGLQPA